MLRRGPRVALGLACLGAALIAAIGVACSPAPALSSARVTPPPEPTSAPAEALTPVVAAPSPTTGALGRQTDDPTAVVVFAVSSVGQALAELGSDFMRAAPEATGVSYRFDKADTLRALIEQGAEADVFVSLEAAPMDRLRQANLLDSAPTLLAADQLTIVVSRSNPQHLQSLKDLGNSGVRFIVPASGSPTTTSLLAAFEAATRDPAYGDDFRTRADRNVLARDGDDHLVISRIVDGEVSAGVVYASSLDASSRGHVQTIALPDSVSAPIEYQIAVLKNAKNRRGGQAFVDYAVSGPGQGILSTFGFARVGSSTTHAAR